MRIGIDVSQLAFRNTGVSNYLINLINALLRIDGENEYVFFFSSLRKRIPASVKTSAGKQNPKVKIKTFKIPPTVLNILWNKFHIFPIEWFIGDVDIFITSDWTEPPVKRAKKVTVLYDLLVYKYPKEMDNRIVQVQRQRLKWIKKESDIVFCISESTQKDAIKFLKISKEKLKVIYPGI